MVRSGDNLSCDFNISILFKDPPQYEIFSTDLNSGQYHRHINIKTGTNPYLESLQYIKSVKDYVFHKVPLFYWFQEWFRFTTVWFSSTERIPAVSDWTLDYNLCLFFVHRWTGPSRWNQLTVREEEVIVLLFSQWKLTGRWRVNSKAFLFSLHAVRSARLDCDLHGRASIWQLISTPHKSHLDPISVTVPL